MARKIRRGYIRAMKIIDRINDSTFQQITLNDEDEGRNIFVLLRYMPFQRRWIMNIEYEGVTINGIALGNSVNVLRNYRNILPFGVAITTSDGFDPYYLQDFSSGRAVFRLLDSSDVAEAESFINEV